MTIGESLLYLVMVAAWVFGIAVAIGKGLGWIMFAIFVPPVAWVLLAQWTLGRI